MTLKVEQIPALALKWANGDEQAAEVLINFAHFARAIDDVIDGDAKDPASMMGNMLATALTRTATNPFYLKHQAAFLAAGVGALIGWRIADDFRKAEDEKTRMFGFVYREAINQIVWMVAYLTGGFDHAVSAAKELHELAIVSSSETLHDWETENV